MHIIIPLLTGASTAVAIVFAMKKNMKLFWVCIACTILCTIVNAWKANQDKSGKDAAEERAKKAEENAEKRDRENGFRIESLQNAMNAIAFQVGASLGHTIDGASLESIQRGILDLKSLVQPKPWLLSEEQVDGLLRMLEHQRDRKQYQIRVQELSGNVESDRFAKQLVGIFQVSGWNATLDAAFLSSMAFSGLSIVSNQTKITAPGILKFVSQMEGFGQPVREIPGKNMIDGEFAIMVGSKP